MICPLFLFSTSLPLTSLPLTFMFDFLIRKQVIPSTQRFIDRLEPKVAVHVPVDLPLPSLKVLKTFSATVAKINALENQMASLAPAQLRAKTEEFRVRYQQMITKEKEDLRRLEDLYWKAVTPEEKNDLQNQVDAARKGFRATRKKSWMVFCRKPSPWCARQANAS